MQYMFCGSPRTALHTESPSRCSTVWYLWWFWRLQVHYSHRMEQNCICLGNQAIAFLSRGTGPHLQQNLFISIFRWRASLSGAVTPTSCIQTSLSCQIYTASLQSLDAHQFPLQLLGMKGAKQGALPSCPAGRGVTEVRVFHCSSAGTVC